VKQAARFITFASLVQVFGFLIALPGHLDEPSWSAHAQFHHVLGWLWLAGFNILILALTWGPLQRYDRWSFRLLVIAFLFAQVGFFATVLLVPEGRPDETWFYAALGLVAAINAGGLVAAWRALAGHAPA